MTHPPKGATGTAGLDHVAGGTAYVRAADTVLWLEHHAELKTVTVKSTSGLNDGVSSILPMTRSAEINRTVTVLKARNGRGGGWRLGYFFDGATLGFDERGIIIKQRSAAQDTEAVA